jgi:hypothetical protein
VAKAIRIPGLVDILMADTPDAVLSLSADDRLDRKFTATGPILNRVIARRIRRVLQVGGTPLPPVSPRDAPGREARQEELEAKVSAMADRLVNDNRHVDELAAHVLGTRDPNTLGPKVQEVLGQIFADDYAASPERWKAAQLLDSAARSFNPVRQAWWRLTGRIERARRLLAEPVGGDPAAVHTTGVAIHNLVRSFEIMRELASRRQSLQGLTHDAVVARCLVAPENVLRQAVKQGTTEVGSFRPGTLVILRLEAARARSLRRDIAFMTNDGNWSRCPANRWVVTLLTVVWGRASELAEEGRT